MSLGQRLLHRAYGRLEVVLVLLVLAGALLKGPGNAGRFRFVGALPLGPDGWTYALYQENEFEPATGVYYEVYHRGRRQSEPEALFGSHDQVEATDFRAGRCGPVLYLRYLTGDTAMQLHALYDTRWRLGYVDSVRWEESGQERLEREQQLRRRLQGCVARP